MKITPEKIIWAVGRSFGKEKKGILYLKNVLESSRCQENRDLRLEKKSLGSRKRGWKGESLREKGVLRIGFKFFF